MRREGSALSRQGSVSSIQIKVLVGLRLCLASALSRRLRTSRRRRWLVPTITLLHEPVEVCNRIPVTRLTGIRRRGISIADLAEPLQFLQGVHAHADVP